MKSRRVWKIAKAGRIDRLRLTKESLDELTPDQIRIRTRAIGLNFADLFAITGLYSATPQAPFIPGLEFCGDVLAVGANIQQVHIGDRLMALTRFGAYADIIDVDAAYCVPLPKDWNYQQGAAFLVQTLTAWYALHSLGNAEFGQTALIHSAAGGVGLQAMQICRHLGLIPIGTVNSAIKQQFLRQCGYSEVIVRGKYFEQQLRQTLGSRELFLILDAIGGSVQKQSYAALSPMGRMIVYGAAEFTPGRNRPRYFSSLIRYLKRPKYDVMDMISSNRSVMAFNLIWLWQHLDLLHTLLTQIQSLPLQPPHVGHSYSFTDVLSALEKLRSGTSIGKVVLTVPDQF